MGNCDTKTLKVLTVIVLIISAANFCSKNDYARGNSRVNTIQRKV